MFFGKKQPTAKPSRNELREAFTRRIDSALADYCDDLGDRECWEILEVRAQSIRSHWATTASIR
jgi:hypothetical protein